MCVRMNVPVSIQSDTHKPVGSWSQGRTWEENSRWSQWPTAHFLPWRKGQLLPARFVHPAENNFNEVVLELVSREIHSLWISLLSQLLLRAATVEVCSA